MKLVLLLQFIWIGVRCGCLLFPFLLNRERKSSMEINLYYVVCRDIECVMLCLKVNKACMHAEEFGLVWFCMRVLCQRVVLNKNFPLAEEIFRFYLLYPVNSTSYVCVRACLVEGLLATK